MIGYLPLPPKINAKEAKDEIAAAKTALTVAIKISLFNICANSCATTPFSSF